MAKASLETMQNQLLAAAELIEAEGAPDLDITFRSMFGGACAYSRGRVFAVLSHAGLALKLASAAQQELLQLNGADPLQFDPDRSPLKQYVVVPTQMLTNEPELAHWIEKSLAHVKTQPAPKPRRKRTK